MAGNVATPITFPPEISRKKERKKEREERERRERERERERKREKETERETTYFFRAPLVDGFHFKA